MSKFKVGDKVVCVDPSQELELLQVYTVALYTHNTDMIALDEYDNGNGGFYESRFELFDEWAKHQKPVSPEVELELTKHQVVMLQDTKKVLQEHNKALQESLTMLLGIIDEPTLIANKQWQSLLAVEDARELLK